MRPLILSVALAGACWSADDALVHGYTDTPFLPGDRWHVHDPARPQPTVISGVAGDDGDQPGRPPSDAIVLFDGRDAGKWEALKGGSIPWKIDGGVLETVPGTGDIRTKDAFGDCQLHVEWASPSPRTGKGNDQGNSGVRFFGIYEVQVFDSYHGGIYADGQAAAVYGQTPPLVNASRKPGVWQVYDILFTAPRFAGDKLVSPAFVTVFHNGVVVQNHTAILGPTRYRSRLPYVAHAPTGFLSLQEHGNPVRYRNIWLRPLAPPGG